MIRAATTEPLAWWTAASPYVTGIVLQLISVPVWRGLERRLRTVEEQIDAEVPEPVRLQLPADSSPASALSRAAWAADTYQSLAVCLGPFIAFVFVAVTEQPTSLLALIYAISTVIAVVVVVVWMLEYKNPSSYSSVTFRWWKLELSLFTAVFIGLYTAFGVAAAIAA